MTAHELAKALLNGPDLPVVINGWGSDEGFTKEVEVAIKGDQSFHGTRDNESTPKDRMGYTLPRPCVVLNY